jgi:hypothetical protein
MGANLDRLMQSYGISTPVMSSYSGTAPTAVAADATPEQQGSYQGALAKYNAEKEAYNKYAADYKNRVMSTDLYSSPAMNILPQAQQKAQWSSNLTTPDYSKIQGPKADVGQPGAAPDYASMVNSAYAGLGRKGIGTEASNIDQAGYDYWTGKLKSGEISPANFHETFMGGAKDYMGANTNNNVTNYVQGYLNKTSQPDNYANLINTAYAGVGRSGIGTGLSNIDQTGYDYWMNKLNSGAIAPDSFNAAFAQGAKGYMGQNPSTDYTKYVQGYLGLTPVASATQAQATTPAVDNTGVSNNMYDAEGNPAYAHGGPVRHFAVGGSNRVDGGINDLADKYAMDNPAELPEIYAAADTGTMTDASAPKRTDRAPAPSVPVSDSRLRDMQNSAVRVGEPPMQRGPAPEGEAAPQMTTPAPVAGAAAAPAPSADDAKEALFKKYFSRPPESAALVGARQRATDSQAAFLKAVNDQMGKTEENAPSKAEMYFRLASALASPTKTGGIMENVALAAKELGDFQKSTTDAKKAAAAAKLQMLLKTHEITWQVAKEELAALEKAESEENVNRRTFGTELIKEQQKNLEPKSELGRRAADEGLTPGTTAYKQRVSELTKADEAQKAQTLATQKASEERKAEEAKKLTPAEVKLKTSLESDVSTQEEALRQITVAIENSPKAFDNTLAGVAKRKFAENKNIFGGKPDPQVTATERMEAALASSILQSAASMKGSLSDKDLSFLRSLSGVGTKSSDARQQILEDAKDKLEREIAKSKKQQADVLAGRYREKTLTQGTE